MQNVIFSEVLSKAGFSGVFINYEKNRIEIKYNKIAYNPIDVICTKR